MAQSATANQFAKSPRENTDTSEGQFGPNFSDPDSGLIKKIKDLYARDTVKILAGWLRQPVDTAKHRLKGDRKFSGKDIAILLRSEHGFEILGAIMADAEPAWWRLVVPLMEAAEIRKMQRAAQRRISKVLEGALDADRELTEAIARADALAVYDAELDRPQLDALRAVARLQDRAVVSTRRK